jgi:hypothetical protein
VVGESTDEWEVDDMIDGSVIMDGLIDGVGSGLVHEWMV